MKRLSSRDKLELFRKDRPGWPKSYQPTDPKNPYLAELRGYFLATIEDRPIARAKVIDTLRCGPWEVYQRLRPWESQQSPTWPETALYPHFLCFDLRDCPELHESLGRWANDSNMCRGSEGTWVIKTAFETIGAWQFAERNGFAAWLNPACRTPEEIRWEADQVSAEAEKNPTKALACVRKLKELIHSQADSQRRGSWHPPCLQYPGASWFASSEHGAGHERMKEKRELEHFDWLVEHQIEQRTYEQIAAGGERAVSRRTVETYVGRLRRELDLPNIGRGWARRREVSTALSCLLP